MDAQESQWLADYRRGDVEALGRLAEAYRRPLYSFILRMGGPRADADEVFQEVWLRAIGHLERFRGTRLLSWLFRIAHNLIIDRARRAGRSPEQPVASEEQAQWLEGGCADPRRAPDAEAAARDLGRQLDAAVQRLPREQREVFLLRAEGDMPFKDIARLQRVSINTALARMQYALAKLRVELKNVEGLMPGERP